VEQVFILVLVGLSSAAAIALGRSRGWPRRALSPALGKMLEGLGLAVVFFAANIALGAVLALAARAAGGFVSLYTVSDEALLALSLLQGLAFQRWREASRAAGTPAADSGGPTPRRSGDSPDPGSASRGPEPEPGAQVVDR
jgi:hypothetical protein